MMTIGEFAALTGLGVKALRHYDERGALTPADVDPFTGYRRYAEGQVRQGVVLKTLREAGVGVGDAAAGITAPADALRSHRAQVLEDRLAEDRAHARALSVVTALEHPVTVSERVMPVQPYVAALLTHAVDTDGPNDTHTANDEVVTAANRLWERLLAEGLQPTGHLWIAMRMQDRDTVELACCLPTSQLLPAEWGGNDIEVGQLPARTELCAVWDGTTGEDPPEDTTHPAVVSLLDAFADHPTAFADVREIRQTATGTGPDDWQVEIALTLG